MEERTVQFQAIVQTASTSREILGEDKILRHHVVCTITTCEEFPDLIGKNITCKQYFLFPENYMQLFPNEKIAVLVPYYRIEDYIKENKSDLQVYDIASLGPRDITRGSQHITIV